MDEDAYKDEEDHPRLRGEHFVLTVTGFFSRDHPRLRGEHTIFPIYLSIPLGSSPLTRGAHRLN